MFIDKFEFKIRNPLKTQTGKKKDFQIENTRNEIVTKRASRSNYLRKQCKMLSKPNPLN